jgi:hypothetical protein
VVRLLFLDDDVARHAAFRRRALKLLKGRASQVIQTSDPREAVQILRTLGPHLSAVFLDRDLGQDLTGEYVARAMTKLPPGRRPKKVVVHSRNFFRAPSMVRALRAAGYHVIRAPFRA